MDLFSHAFLHRHGSRAVNLSLLVQLCGIPLVVVLVGLGLALTAIAIFLTIRVKHVPLLVAFLPLTMLPIMAGVVTALLGTLNSISVQLNPESELAVEPGFLLLMNLVPLLAGIVASIPPALISVVGRWALTWRTSGLQIMPRKASADDDEEDQPPHQEADEYLRQLVRPR